jgi:hypothetical protein
MSANKDNAIKIVEEKFQSHETLRFEVADSDEEFVAVEAYSKSGEINFSLYHWIVSCDTNEIWIADSQLPFIVNVALIQRGAGILL